MGERNTALFLVTDIIVLIVFIGLIFLTFNLSGLFIIGELALLFALLFFSLVALVAVYYKIRFGSTLLMSIFAIVLINLLFIYFKKGSINSAVFFITMLLSLIGFLIAVASIKRDDDELEDEAPIIEENQETMVEEKPNPFVEERQKPIPETTKPGKFAASKTGSSYHAPKCEWAKKIKKEKLVWFDSEDAAKKDGYKAHSCLK